jgi:VanZ family protein
VVRRLIFAVAVVAQLVALYWPRPVQTGTSLPVDKVVHLAIFAAALWTGVRAGLRPRPLAAVLVVHAALSEVLQATLLDRDGNLADAAADVAGVALGWLLAVRGGGSRGAVDTPADEGAPDRR